jgi:hypothetical protein
MDIEKLAREHRLESARRREAAAERRDDIVNRAGVELVYKTNHDARVSAPAAVPSDDDGDFNAIQCDILAHLVSELRAETRDAFGKLEREIFVLRSELALERQVRALHDEVAAARAEVPKLPEIESRADAKQSKLAAEQKRLERELAKTQDRVSKMRVDQSVADHELKKHIKRSKPAVELHFQTAEASFAVRDLHPDAAAAWREFCSGLVSEQQNQGASLRIIDPTSPTGLTIGLPVRSRSGSPRSDMNSRRLIRSLVGASEEDGRHVDAEALSSSNSKIDHHIDLVGVVPACQPFSRP